MADRIDQRVLGAIRLLDRATNNIILRPLSLSADEAKFNRNRSNLYVITHAVGLEHHTTEFEVPPVSPATGTIEIDIIIADPSARYLPRVSRVALPRDADPEHSDQSDSLFQAINVALYASANSPVLNNWSTVRASVFRNDSEDGRVPVRGSLLRIVRISNDEVLASGLSDERGEALIIIPGVPITRFADEDDDEDSVQVSELPVRLEVSYSASEEWPLDPDVLEDSHSDNLQLSQNLSLRTGRMEKTTIELGSI